MVELKIFCSPHVWPLFFAQLHEVDAKPPGSKLFGLLVRIRDRTMPRDQQNRSTSLSPCSEPAVFFLGRGDSGCFHWEDWNFVSGS